MTSLCAGKNAHAPSGPQCGHRDVSFFLERKRQTVSIEAALTSLQRDPL